MHDYTQLIFLFILIIISIFSSAKKKKRTDTTDPGNWPENFNDETEASDSGDMFSQLEKLMQPPSMQAVSKIADRRRPPVTQGELAKQPTSEAPSYKAIDTSTPGTNAPPAPEAKIAADVHATGHAVDEPQVSTALATALKKTLHDPSGVKEAFILHEIFGQPLALRNMPSGGYGKKV